MSVTLHVSLNVFKFVQSILLFKLVQVGALDRSFLKFVQKEATLENVNEMFRSFRV